MLKVPDRQCVDMRLEMVSGIDRVVIKRTQCWSFAFEENKPLAT